MEANERRKEMTLTPEIRDELLIRLDERVKELKEEDLPEIKRHLERINGCVQAADIRSKVNRWMIVSMVGGTGLFGAVAKLNGLW